MVFAPAQRVSPGCSTGGPSISWPSSPLTGTAFLWPVKWWEPTWCPSTPGRSCTLSKSAYSRSVHVTAGSHIKIMFLLNSQPRGQQKWWKKINWWTKTKGVNIVWFSGFPFRVSVPLCLFCFFTCPSVRWVPLTGGLASLLGSLGTRSGVCLMDFIHHCVVWPAALPLFHQSHFCRWSDKTDLNFLNWAKASSRTRKNGLCVTMSSSTGEDLQRHPRLCSSALRLFGWELLNVCVCVAGKWSASKCSEPHGYICKRKTVSVVETPREPHYIGQCPEKWLYFGHKVQTHNCWHNLYKLTLDAIVFNSTSSVEYSMQLKSCTYC